MALDKFDIDFIKRVKMLIEQRYDLSRDVLDRFILKFREMMLEDSKYVYHYDEEYWADYIAKLAEKEDKKVLASRISQIEKHPELSGRWEDIRRNE